jgi:DNA recombination protein RmuC
MREFGSMLTFTVALAALLLGGAIAWISRERECSALRDRATTAETQLIAERAGVQEQMKAQFQELAQRTLDTASSTFLNLATTKLGEERETLQGIVNPVREEFQKFERAVNELKEKNATDLGSLKTSLEQVAQLQTNLQDAVRTTNEATGQLRSALQNPHRAGSWGEISLRRIVEVAGMTEHCDFDERTGVVSADGTREIPDMTIKLTGGLTIPVDAKTPMTNFIRAIGEADEEQRKLLLQQSARDLKQRIADLRTRNYDRIDGYAGMTFVFVGSEAMLSSALTAEPNLLEDALQHRIVICSPLLLLCYLRAFAHGWSLQSQRQNAEDVARYGERLYHRLKQFFISLNDVGTTLRRTVTKFNDAVAKTDNLLVPGRKLGELLGSNRELQAVNDVDVTPRELTSNAEVDSGTRAAS